MTNGAIHVTVIVTLELVKYQMRGRNHNRYVLLSITGSASCILSEAGSAGIAEGLHPLNTHPAHTCRLAVRKVAPPGTRLESVIRAKGTEGRVGNG